MSRLLGSMRRLSRSSDRNQNDRNQNQNQGPVTQQSPPSAYPNTPPLTNASMMPNGSIQHDSRPVSNGSDASFEFTSRPMSNAIPQSTVSNLSRTDQIVLRHFWEYKSQENSTRDLHFLKFPHFPQNPSHKDLIPYCEIYHLVKTSPGAKIISLGSANGVYIGFELFSGSQLHIDMDDEWTNIAHYRVTFKPYESVLKDPSAESTFRSWPKPLTIEFLEDQYQKWCQDLTSPCWDAREVRELGSGGQNETAGPL